jgi:hypothetical protein
VVVTEETAPETTEPTAPAPLPRAEKAASRRPFWRRSALLSALADDRPLLIATAVMILLALAPLFAAPFMPLADLPDSTAAAALLVPTALKQGLAYYHYKLNLAPIPYWTTYLLVAFLSPLIGALAAAKVLVGVTVVSLPLAVMRVLLALGRDIRLGLWAFLLGWGFILFAGWVAFLVGMNLALWATAWLLTARTARDAIGVFLLSAVVAFTHAQAAIYLACMCPLLVLMRWRWSWQSLRASVACAAGISSVILPWMASSIRVGKRGARVPFDFDFDGFPDKLGAFFHFTLDNQIRPLDQAASALAFVVLLFGPLLLVAVAGRGKEENEDGQWRVEPALAFFVVPFVLYAALPMTIRGPISHWFTYPRYATHALVALLFLPRLSLRGTRAWLLLPGVLAFVFFQIRIFSQISDYATRSRPFLEVIANVAPNSSYLPLELDDTDPVVKLDPYNQIHAYIAAVKGGFDPHLFDNASIPLLYRSERRLPQTAWNAAASFSLENQGQYYDYVLVQGLRLDPLAGRLTSKSAEAKLVVEAGRFRLYKIIKRKPASP